MIVQWIRNKWIDYNIPFSVKTCKSTHKVVKWETLLLYMTRKLKHKEINVFTTMLVSVICELEGL